MATVGNPSIAPLRSSEIEAVRSNFAEVAVMPPREALAALDRRPERKRLKAIDVGHPGGVCFVCLEGPERLELGLTA